MSLAKRDKEAKINRILDSTKILIEKKGYENVSIRSITEEAEVSIGLIYKYFPNGKIDIIKEIGNQYQNEQLMMEQPEKIDFNDFPGYIREVIKKMKEVQNKNSGLVKALTAAALLNKDELLEDIKFINVEDYKAIPDFFSQFDGVNISNEDSITLLTEWSVTVKSLILYNTIFPTIFKNEEEFLELMVDISLKIWGYTKGN